MIAPVLLLLLACSGSEPETPTPAAASAVPAELVGRTWQVRLAPAAARAEFEGKDGWVALFENRRADALRAFAAAGDAAGAARMHLEYAALYRQAALVGSHAAIQVWLVDAQPTDPVETAFVVGQAGVLTADEEAAKRLGASSASKTAPLGRQDAAWQAWFAGKPTDPPDAVAATGPGAPAADAPGPLPDLGALPHYEVRERTPEALPVGLADLGSVWALARWHEQKALAGPPEVAAVVPGWLEPWRLPVEAAVTDPVLAVPDSLLFLSTASTAGDVGLLQDLASTARGREPVVTALADHVADSPYAAVLTRCLGPERIDESCVSDEGAALARAITDAMAAANGGVAEAFHRPFADYARLGLLVAATLASEALMDPTQAARFRLAGLDRATGGARDPLFLLSVAAVDARNRYSLRAGELVHELLPQIPGLEAARVPLDALHVRVSRNAAPGRPMH